MFEKPNLLSIHLLQESLISSCVSWSEVYYRLFPTQYNRLFILPYSLHPLQCFFIIKISYIFYKFICIDLQVAEIVPVNDESLCYLIQSCECEIQLYQICNITRWPFKFASVVSLWRNVTCGMYKNCVKHNEITYLNYWIIVWK